MYLAQDEQTAFLEVFGDRIYQKYKIDIPATEWSSRQFSTIHVPAAPVADLFSPEGLQTAGTDLAALTHRDLRIPQSWGLSVMKYSPICHGLLFRSRFTAQICIAVFEIPGDRLPVVVSTTPFQNSSTARDMLAHYHINLT